MGLLVRDALDETRAGLARQRLGGAAYERLFASVRKRLERDGDSARSVSLPDLRDAERRAIADLHGWSVVPEGTVRVDLVRLDAALRETAIGAGLIAVVEALGGPLRDLRAEESAARDARQDQWERALRHPVVSARPALESWIEDLRTHGLVARAASGLAMEEPAVLSLALRFVERLPAERLPQSVLAAEVAGDAHALDLGRPLGGIVLRAAARLAQWPVVPPDAAGRRRLWAEVGVLCDPLSANALTLGLRPVGERRLAGELRGASDDGEPRRLTLRELMRNPLEFKSGSTVWVCENPAVVTAAAEALGARCKPLLCTEGIPSTAVMTLVEQLRRSGVTVAVRADFDWAGIQIASMIWKAAAAVPWRYCAADYVELISGQSVCTPLRGQRVATPWDEELQRAMEQHALGAFEEQLIGKLMTDLECNPGEIGDHSQ